MIIWVATWVDGEGMTQVVSHDAEDMIGILASEDDVHVAKWHVSDSGEFPPELIGP